MHGRRSTVTCDRAAGLAVDESTSFDMVVTVGTAAEGDMINTATVSSLALDPASTNDTATDDVTVIPSADVSIAKTHTDEFIVGQESIWSIDVANAGPSASNGPIVVTDSIPEGFDIVDATGTDWTCDVADQDVTCTRALDLAVESAPTISVTVMLIAGFEGPTSNTVTVTSTIGDPTRPTRPTDEVEIIASVDLVLEKSLLESTLVVGSTGTYVLVVTTTDLPTPSAWS